MDSCIIFFSYSFIGLCPFAFINTYNYDLNVGYSFSKYFVARVSLITLLIYLFTSSFIQKDGSTAPCNNSGHINIYVYLFIYTNSTYKLY